MAAVHRLARLGEPVVAPLIAKLKSIYCGSEWKDIADALSMIGESAVAPLIAVLKDSESNNNLVDCAAKTLGQIGNISAVEPLIAVLWDKAGNVRMEVAEALGNIGDRRAVNPMIDSLKDKQVDVRWSVAKSLDKIGWQPTKDAIGAWYWIAKNEWPRNQCIAIGIPAVLPLITSLSVYNKDIRNMATQALGQIGDASAVKPLISLLNDIDSNVRRNVSEALSKIGASSIYPLITAIKDEDNYSNIRWGAAQILASNYELLNGISADDKQNLIETLAEEIRDKYSQTRVIEEVWKDTYCDYKTFCTISDPDWDGIHELWKITPEELRNEVGDLSGICCD